MLRYEKIGDSEKFTLLQPKQIQGQNGLHLFCTFCGCSYFEIKNLVAHIKRRHKQEFVMWVIAKMGYAKATYELNQLL